MALPLIVITIGLWLLGVLPELIHLGLEAAHIYHVAMEIKHFAANPYQCPEGNVTSIAMLDDQLSRSRNSRRHGRITGRILTSVPMAHPCFPHHTNSNRYDWNNDTYWNGTAWRNSGWNGTAVAANETKTCRDIQEHYHDDAYRKMLMGSYAWDTSTMCLGDTRRQCLLNDEDVYDETAYANGTCAQGVIPSTGFPLLNICDARLAFEYSGKTGRPLVVKNTGVDYLGRSAHPDALMLWMRRRTFIRHEKFYNHRTILTMEAGTTCGEAYEYGFKHNLTVLCASSPSVGMSGGWLLSGGYSVLSNKYGMGVDRVTSYILVMPDGSPLSVKEYAPRGKHEKEHFWALSGAGAGGNFGLVLSTRHLVEPQFPVVIADIRFHSTSLQDTLDWVRLLAEEAVAWSNVGWGGHVVGTHMAYITAMQNVSDATETLRRASEFALARNGSSTITWHTSFEPYYRRYIEPNNHTAGGSGLVTSRLIGSADIDEKIGQDLMVSYFEELLRRGDGQIYIDATTPVNYVQKREASLTDGWRRSVWNVRSIVPLHYNYTLEQRKTAVKKLNRYTRLLKEISPATGTYSAEANMFDKDWRQDFWGHENYVKLLEVYKRVKRPHKLNIAPCQRCIGWTESMASNCTKDFEDLGEL